MIVNSSQEVTDITLSEGSLMASIDIGSNSFHMVIAKLAQGELQTLDLMSEKVQLAAGLNHDSVLDADTINRGLECLKRFAQRLKTLPKTAIRAVATNALREAINRKEFVKPASDILGVELQVISGHEEARLIYLGVAHSLANSSGNRLVIDIGGGSTEFIIGSGFEPHLLESLQIGCVSFTERYFADGIISDTSFNRCRMNALQQLLSIKRSYRDYGWQNCIGSSGTTKAIMQACIELNLSDGCINLEILSALKRHIFQYNHVNDLPFSSIKSERKPLVPAGLAILTAIFESFKIQELFYSDGGLREGVLYDMVGRQQHEDVRERSIEALIQRYRIDFEHANRVESTALFIFAQVRDAWNLNDRDYHDLLCWAAQTHEIGLSISHNRFHHHSAYLLQNSDLSGFSHSEQTLIAFLARAHRRKFPKEELKLLPENKQDDYLQLSIILRIAVLLHRSRSNKRIPSIKVTAESHKICLEFAGDWLAQHPLTQQDLDNEADYLKSINYRLKYLPNP